MSLSRLTAYGLGLTLASGVLLAQEQRPSFRAGTVTIPVYATVTDDSGAFVLDLQKEDFEVKDDGKVQAITQFTVAAQPLSTVLLIDGSASMMDDFDRVIDGANSFIVRMLPGDRTRLGSFADRAQFSSTFTNNRDDLLDYLKQEFNIRVGMETRLWHALGASIDLVRKETGRRVVLVISDGKDWVQPGLGLPAIYNPGQVLSLAQSSDVIIYAVSMWVRQDNQMQRPGRELQDLAVRTGGGFYELVAEMEVNATFTQIAKELHNQYVLGFVTEKLDGKTHSLDVKLKRPGMRVKARKSYVVEKQ